MASRKAGENLFVAHIHEEARLAALLKRQIVKDFLGMINVFVSSDGENIQVGMNWLTAVDSALKAAKVELLICSKESIKRPWVNFEAGAGWVKGIYVVPVCHSGLRISDLPLPLNLLEAIEANKPHDLDRLYELLANQLGSAKPSGNFEQLAQEVEEFERSYRKILHPTALGAPHLLHHVSLPVKDLKASTAFYRRLLDLDPLPQAPSPLERHPFAHERPFFIFGGSWFVLPSGQHLHLVENNGCTFRGSNSINPRDCHFALRVKDFNCAKMRLIEMGVHFDPDPLGMGYQQLYFVDDDNHIVEINAGF